jgi:phasin family protein
MNTKKPATRSNRRAPAAAVEPVANAGREIAEKTRVAAAELAEEGAESVRRVAEQHGLQLHKATLAAGKTGEELAARAQDGAASLARSGQGVAAGLTGVGRLWAELVQDGMRESMAATQSLLRARSFGEAMRIQGEYLKSSFELLLDTTAEISDLSKQMLSTTAHRMASGVPHAPRLPH